VDDLSRTPPQSTDPLTDGRLRRLARAAPVALTHAEAHLRAWGLQALVTALSLGWLVWPMMNIDRLPMFVDNKLPLAERWAFVAWTLGLAVPVLAYFDAALFNFVMPDAAPDTLIDRIGWGWLWLGLAAVVFRMIQLTAIQSRRVALVWCIKILTDPFHDAVIYRKSPIYLLKGQLIDPDLRQDYED
jgi:hypothetical protein